MDNWGHLGGMISGFGLAYLVFDTIDPPVATDKYNKIAAGVMVGIYFVGGLVLFYTVVDSNSDR